MARCDFANGRIGARRSRLLGGRGLRDLLVRRDLGERLEMLRQAGYAAAVPAPPPGPDALSAAERGLGDLVRREARELGGHLEGALQRDLYRAFLLFEEAETLKTALRGIVHSEPADRVLALAAPTRSFPAERLRALAALPDPAAAAALLEAWENPFAAAVRRALPGIGKPGGLLRLEVAVDRTAQERALAAARGRGEDRAVMRRLLSARADLANAATLLKLVGSAEAGEFFLPGGAALGADRFAALSRLPPAALRQQLSRLLRRWLGAPDAARALERPSRAEGLLERGLARAMRAEARARPHSLAVPLAYLHDRLWEVRRIRLVLRGAEYGLPADDLLDLLEA